VVCEEYNLLKKLRYPITARVMVRGAQTRPMDNYIVKQPAHFAQIRSTSSTFLAAAALCLLNFLSASYDHNLIAPEYFKPPCMNHQRAIKYGTSI
jgi:hypothetical protein